MKHENLSIGVKFTNSRL